MQYLVVVAGSKYELAGRAAEGDAAWCGLKTLLDGRNCDLQISPFQRQFIGIRSSNGGGWGEQ